MRKYEPMGTAQSGDSYAAVMREFHRILRNSKVNEEANPPRVKDVPPVTMPAVIVKGDEQKPHVR